LVFDGAIAALVAQQSQGVIELPEGHHKPPYSFVESLSNRREFRAASALEKRFEVYVAAPKSDLSETPLPSLRAKRRNPQSQDRLVNAKARRPNRSW
jgi:hypothetical protein